MSHKNKKKLSEEVYDVLRAKEGFGRSKHQDKTLGLDENFIYSFSTMKTYIKHCCYFVDWCRINPQIRNELGHRPRTLEECKPYVATWIRTQEERGLSAYTVKLEKSALEKLYGEKWDFATKGAKRSGINRSRWMAKRDSHFSLKKNAELINACQCIGFRRSELEQAKAEDLFEKDGQWYVSIVGKGGKHRNAPVLGNDERAINFVRGLTGKNKVHSSADIHSYRADYAKSIYHLNCSEENFRRDKFDYTELTGKTNKDGSHIYKSTLYHCRGEKKGVTLDRVAMIKAAQALGHNRESVVGEHYLWWEKPFYHRPPC